MQLRCDLHVARARIHSGDGDSMEKDVEEFFDALPEADRVWANETFEREHQRVCPGLAHCTMVAVRPPPRRATSPVHPQVIAIFAAVAFCVLGGIALFVMLALHAAR
mgnify:CR=1 FL=1